MEMRFEAGTPGKWVNRYIFVFITMFLTSCANYGSNKYFERDPKAIESTMNVADYKDRATVYIFRQDLIMLPFNPIHDIQHDQIVGDTPPYFYAVDGKMLSIMPVGSHVVLSLEPGKHTFTRFQLTGFFVQDQLKRNDTVLDLVGGQTYYFGSQKSGMFSPANYGLVDNQYGHEIVANTKLAKLIHQPVSTDVFVSRFAAAERKRKEGVLSSSPAQSSSQDIRSDFQDALPSSKQVGDFLEIVATVALIAVLIIGGAVEASNSISSPPQPSYYPPPTAGYSVPAPITTTWHTSSDTLSEILNTKGETTIDNISTGVQYRINNGQVIGSDGSHYQVNGSTMYSDTGQMYQVSGNNIFASDGSSCVKTGVMISCK